jgi:flagellar basal body L-ring protein FlgH
MKVLFFSFLFVVMAEPGLSRRKPSPALSPLDQYLQEAVQGGSTPGGSATAGSLFQSNSRLAELGRDFRAQSVDDLVTILVADRASAVGSQIQIVLRVLSRA